MEVEWQNRRYQDMLFRANEAFLEEEKKKEVLKETIRVECYDYYYRETLHREEVSELRVEIADLRDKARDFGLRNDYLDYKVYELEDALERKVSLRSHIEKEKRYSIKKMMLENHCNMLEKDLNTDECQHFPQLASPHRVQEVHGVSQGQGR
jgi:predicted RNase H-like nuclease (RuvC/YqgF family)